MTKQKQDPVIREFSRLAEKYDEKWRFYISATAHQTIARLKLTPADFLLDVGCGTGGLLRRLCENHPAAQLCGVDPARPMLAVARRKLPPSVFLCEGWAEQLPFAAGQFDAVVSCNMFHYIRRPAEALREMRRVLRPGGRLIVTDWCDDFFACRICGWYLRMFGRGHFKVYRKREFARLLEESGCAVGGVESYKINWLWGLMTAQAKKVDGDSKKAHYRPVIFQEENVMSNNKDCCGPGYASPMDAIRAPRERLIYTVALYVGTGIDKPDYLTTIDADPESPTFSQVIHRLEMPGIGDELHHVGWNACSSCHGDASKERRYLIVPGVRTANIHIVDCAADPRAPRLHKVIDGAEIKRKTNLSAPHTVHCLGSDIIISMLGDANGEAPGGFLLLNENFEIVGRWENDISAMKFNYDFWYQPRHNVMVSSEWAAPNTFMPGFDLDDVGKGKYGDQIHFWDFAKKSIVKTEKLGEQGMIPLELRFHHNPDSTHGFVGATLSSNIFHWHKNGGGWEVEKVIDVPSVDIAGWPIPVPSLITDILISMDDRFLYFSNWLQGDVRQYDISDPSHPKLTGQVFVGGLPGAPNRATDINGHSITGGPQMIQLSLDGKRLYVTNSLFSTWDNQFYPDMKEKGGCMMMLDCDGDKGGLSVNPKFFVDFAKEPNGPARCHEMRYPGGDCTSDIWL